MTWKVSLDFAGRIWCFQRRGSSPMVIQEISSGRRNSEAGFCSSAADHWPALRLESGFEKVFEREMAVALAETRPQFFSRRGGIAMSFLDYAPGNSFSSAKSADQAAAVIFISIAAFVGDNLIFIMRLWA